MIIPVGVNATKNAVLTFTANIQNIPDDIDVFIEDKESEKLIRIDQKKSFYKVTLTEDLSGTGRFFIHTKNNTLSIYNNLEDDNSITVFNAGTKLIVKSLKEKAGLQMYSLLGKKVIDFKLANKAT